MKKENYAKAANAADEFGLVFEERQADGKTIAQAERVLEKLIREYEFDGVNLVMSFYELIRDRTMRSLKLGEIAQRVAGELAANGDEIGAERITKEYGIAKPKMQ